MEMLSEILREKFKWCGKKLELHREYSRKNISNIREGIKRREKKEKMKK